MASSSKKRIPLLLALFLLLIIGTALIVSFLPQRQTTQQEASGATSLSFTPESSLATPISKKIGDTLDLDLIVNPGTDAVTFIKFQIQYDPTKLEITSTNPFTLDTALFSGFVEGPVLENGLVTQSVSVGSDPTKAIRTPTRVGTLRVKAIGATGNTPATLSFTAVSQALSAGSDATAAQNVLSTTIPAYIAINQATTPTATPTTVASLTTLTFNLLLHGIGTAGDNPNPTANSLSNKNPLHSTRNIEVLIYDANNNIVSNTSGSIEYNETKGSFEGTVPVEPAVTDGTYTIKIKSDRYLRRLIPGVHTIQSQQNNVITTSTLIAGDTDNNNSLNVLDYNALLDCGYDDLSPLPITNSQATFHSQICQAHQPTINNDLDDNGTVNSADYNLFLRELSVQAGD